MSKKVEKQFFRKSTNTFFEQMRKLVYERLQVSVDVLDEVLVKDPKCQGKEIKMTEGIQSAAKKISDTLAMEIDRFELFVGRNVFTTPNNITKNNNQLLSIIRGNGDSTGPPPSNREPVSKRKPPFPPQSRTQPPEPDVIELNQTNNAHETIAITKKRKIIEQSSTTHETEKPSKKRKTTSSSTTPVTSEDLDKLRKNILQQRALKAWLEREIELQTTDTGIFKDFIDHFPEFWKMEGKEKSGETSEKEQLKAINVTQLTKILENSNEIFKNVCAAETAMAAQDIQLRRGDPLVTKRLTRNKSDINKVFEMVNKGNVT